MFIFIKKLFCIVSLFLLRLLSTNPLNAIPLTCISLKIRSKIVDVNSNNPIFYPFSIKINVAVAVITLIIHMQKFVFLIL